MGFSESFKNNDKYFLLELNNDIEREIDNKGKIEFKSFDGIGQEGTLYLSTDTNCYKCIRNAISNTFFICDNKCYFKSEHKLNY